MEYRRKGMELGIVAIFWLLILSIIPISSSITWPNEFWYHQVILAILLTLMYYANRQYFLSRYFDQGKYIQYGILAMVLIAGSLSIIYFFDGLIGLPQKLHELFHPDIPYDPARRHIFDYGFFSLLLFDLSISVIVHLTIKGQEEREMRKELEQLQMSTELSYLKAQINPHFFFNTLNNIYALTGTDIEASQEALLKLSSMMRYVIYDNESRKATLADEINFIENYIELMKLRLSNRVSLTFTKPDHSVDLPIAPMILLPFVENAFKHGVSSSKATEIIINIAIEQNTLQFYVENTLLPRRKDDQEESGIGIANTRRRLQLLYPGRHHFEIGEEGEKYKVRLSIDL